MSKKILLFILVLIPFPNISIAQLKEGEGKTNVHGGQIWYRVIGKGKGTPILMLHGGPGGTSRSFYQFESIGIDRLIIIPILDY
jgi:proline iminopeptidase